GFCFAMGWIPAPPVNKVLVIGAIAVIVLTAPVAWHKLFQFKTGYVPEGMIGQFFWDTRDFIEPVRWKTWVGGWRYLHFLAVGYLAFAAVGKMGIRLTTGWGVVQRTAQTRFVIRCVTGAALLLTFPYTYISEIKYLVPALDTWFFENIPLVDGRYLGILHLLHLAALITFLWHSVGDAWRQWLIRDAFLRCVPVIRKVGTQSLAVFLVSIVLSRFNGAWMDGIDAWLLTTDWTYVTERDVWVRAMVNLTGFGVLIATAYFCGWIKSQPWRDKAQATKPAPQSQNRSQAVPAE
ncbi:MAG: OpgC domain-containing protein, partial [Pseudomonadota bacterium]